ncbi:MAG: shikimate dehydrogenase [Bacteroidota bacterium]
MTEQPVLLGLIGYPLTHSFSAGYFADKFQRENIPGFHYMNFPLNDITELPHIIHSNPKLAGLNVTIPYKQAVIPYLDDIDPAARQIGAVNVIKIDRQEGQPFLTGFNTDVEGFGLSLAQWDLPIGIMALVFGTGGSSKAVRFVLEGRQIPYISVSRNQGQGVLRYEQVNAALLDKYKLLINCTPVGMFPAINNKLPLPYQALTNEHYLFDLIYNPGITQFMQEGLDHASHVQGGVLMLKEQAEASWRIWIKP